jgi:hypothetical protein
MTALPAGLPTDDFVTIAGSDVRRVTAANMINGTAWKLGGNSAPVSNLFGTTTAHDVVFVTGVGGTPRFTLTAAGALTQAPAGGVVTFTGNTNATNGLNVTGATNLTGVTTQAGALGVTGATTINTGGGASTSIGNAAGGAVSIASGTSVTIDPGAGAGNVVIPNIDLDAATTKILTLDGANNVRHRTITAGTNIVTGAGTANRVTRWTPDGATIGNSVMTDDGTNVGISTTGTINIASTTSNDVTINVSGAGGNDLVLTGIDSDPATTTVLTLDASGNVRTRALSGGPGIITGAGTLNTIAMWTPDGMTLGNSTITQNAGATLVTITNALTQAGGGQVIFSGNVDANGGLDVNGATNLTGATVQTGSFAVTGATTINTAGAALTTIGGANTVRIAATDVEMTALPAGATTDDFVTINGTNDVRRVSAATMINGTAWKLGGNASPVSNLFGTTTAHDVVFVTGVGGTPRFTLTAAGALTQAPAGGVVTFTGNTNATNGLNVTGATNLTGITTQAGAFGVTGATTINTGGASTTSIGHVGGGAVSLASASTVTLDPSAAGNIKALNVDQDETTTKVMTLDGSDNVRWRTVSATGTILTGSGTPNRHARWATATTLTDGLIDDNGATITFLTNDVRVQGSTPVYTANSAPGTRKILVMNTADGQIQQAAFPVVTYGNRSLRVSGAELVPSTFTDDGTNFNLTTTGTITLASTTASDIVVDVTGAGGNDLTLLGIDVNTTATDVLVLDASGNVRKRSIGGGPNPIVTGSGTLNTIPKWTPDGFTLGNSNLTDDGSTVTVSSAASFNTNGHTNLGDATTDNVVVRGNLRTTGAANQFAGRVMITGAGGATTFTVSNNLVQANSIIIVSLEDGTNTSDFTATVRNKVVTTGFDVRLSAPLAAGQTKWINYQIINQ